MATVKILNKSQNQSTNEVLTTFLIEGFPKCLLAELNTHRMLSRNCESSRARPITSVIEQVLNDPYIPPFTANRKGMSGDPIDEKYKDKIIQIYLESRDDAVLYARRLQDYNIHKQDVNRILEPYMKVSLIISGTTWKNFFSLRTAEGVQPAFKEVAELMQSLFNQTPAKVLPIGALHLPYPDLSPIQNIAKIASISYAKHNADRTDEDALRLVTMLWESKHLSPFEMVAVALPKDRWNPSNYHGWFQSRHFPSPINLLNPTFQNDKIQHWSNSFLQYLLTYPEYWQEGELGRTL